MSTLVVDQLQGATNNTITIPAGTTITNSGTANNFGVSDPNASSSTLVKQWINYKGSSTNEIRDSINCSSVTDSSAGNYRPVFTNNMDNTTYALYGCSDGRGSGDTPDDGMFVLGTTSTYSIAQATNTYGILCGTYQNGSRLDIDNVHIHINGDLV
tara:strand:- start:76 stop:543 length:468 start_codon:yes stop_codon:yes gene_type:complete